MSGVFPASKQEIKALYVALKASSDMCGCDTPLRRWNCVKQFVGAHPYVQYRLAEHYKLREEKRALRLKKRREHEQREAAWYGGERMVHYLKKFGAFGGHHGFLTAHLAKATGMVAYDEESWDVYPAEELEEYFNTPSPPKIRWSGHSATSDMRQRAYIIETPTTPQRSIMLLTKLRAYITALRTQTLVAYNAPVGSVRISDKVVCEVGEPQMEGRTGEELGTIRTENVILTEENPASRDIACNVDLGLRWQKMCTTDTSQEYNHLLNRWTYWKSFEWTVDDTSESEIVPQSSDLPYDFVTSVAQNGSMPMLVPFKIYRYFKSDIEIKIHVNSNKFQVGQLQFSWQYMEKYDGNKLNNIYSRSQLPHILLNAGASNEATLYIPFKYVQPFLVTNQRKSDVDCLYLGTLRCFVTSRLATGEGGPRSCGISYFIRFPNAVFTGLRDGDVAEPQMMEAAATAMVASRIYDSVIGDKNCDKVSNYNNPKYFVPTGTHPWCNGKGVEDTLLSLRLDGSTRAVGRTGIDDSETSIGVPCRVFGMLRHFFWDSGNRNENITGKLIYSIDVHPQLEASEVFSTSKAGEMTAYAFPPVSIISGMYKQWRGSLEFKFDIIASMFHTGRLLCAYIPGFYGDAKKITLAQARNSPHIEFSLQDATSFTFVVPYISDKVWWNRKYTGPHKYGEFSAPSKLVMFVLNPLIPMQDVVKKVEIIPYVRAGVDFEVSVPVQPSFGLSDNCVNIIKNSSYIYPTAGSFPMRATNYKGFGDDKFNIYYEGTAALGTASTFFKPDTKLEDNEYFFGSFFYPSKAGTMVYTSKVSKKEMTSKIGYIVLWDAKDKGIFGVPFPANEEGIKYANLVAKSLKLGKSFNEIAPYLYEYIRDGSDSSSSLSDLFINPEIRTIDDFEIIERGDPEMERVSTENMLQPTQNLPSTFSGRFNYNEEFNDLKDLARRYQLYASAKVKLDDRLTTGSAVVVFPVIPHGLELDVQSEDKTFNMCRDGPIPLISSSYTYFRGSMRFKVMMETDDPSLASGKIWVQHHPDGDCIKPQVQVYPKIEDEDQFKSHGYGFYIQNVHINGILEFEVPFYQSGMYGITRKPASYAKNICQYRTLGNIVAGVHVVNKFSKSNIKFQIYYSIGDDFSFNVFRGFPMVVRTDEVWPDEVDKKKKIQNRRIVYITGDPEMGDVEYEMMSYVSKKVFGTTPSDIASGMAANMAEAISSEIKSRLSSVKIDVNTIHNTLKDNFSSTALVAALGNLLHVLHNPTPGTIAISVANIIVTMLGTTVVSLVKLVKIFTDYITKFWHNFVPSGITSAMPQSDISQENIALGSLIFTAVSTMFGVGIAGPRSYPDVMKNINSAVSLSNNVMRLVQNSSDLILYCFRYISAKLYPTAALSAKFCNDVPIIKLWYEECTYLLDARVRSRYLYDKSMMSRVFDACVTGSLLVINGMDRSSPSGKIVCDTYKEIKKIRNDLFEKGVHPDVRFEVYPLWLSGEAGIGKSFMVKRLINDLLRSVDYQAPGSLIYDIPSGAKYWSGCGNPAALVSDDIFQVGGTRREEELANLFTICSSSVLNPPMAAVEDKEKRINPLIYMMLCNNHFPELQPMVSTPEAVYRRRKFLMYARLKPELKEQYPNFRDAGQLPREITSKMEHLEFSCARNVKDPATTYGEWMNYDDLLKMISADFKQHYTNERLNFRERMIDMYCLDPNFNETNMILEMPDLKDHESLEDQIRKYKNYIQMKAAMLEDPEDVDCWKYVRQFLQKTKVIRAEAEMDVAQDALDMFATEGMNKIETIINDSIADVEITDLNRLLEEYPSVFKPLEGYHNKYKSIFYEVKELGVELIGNGIIDDLPYAYLTPFVHNDSAALTLSIKNLIRSWSKGVDNNHGSVYNKDTVNKLMRMADFDILELIRFICIFPGGVEDLVTCLVDNIEISTHPLVTDQLLYARVNSTTSFGVHVDAGIGFEKDATRLSLMGKNFLPNHSARMVFLKQIFNKIDIFKRAGECDVMLIEGLYSFYTGTVMGLRRSILNWQNIIKKKPDTSCKFFNLVCEAYSYALLADVIFGDHTPCPCRNSYALLVQNFEMTDFCCISNKLILDGNVVTSCKNIACMYNNDFSYFYFCELSQSCKRVAYNGYGVCEISEIEHAIVKRRMERSLSTFDKIKDWFKCLIYHKVPIVISKILKFLIHAVPVILAVLAAVGISKVVCHYTGWEPPTRAVYDIIRPNTSSEPQANYFKLGNPKHHVKNSFSTHDKRFATGAAQMGVDQRVSVAKRIESNSIMLYATWQDGEERCVRSCNNLMIKGRSMLVLRHYIEEYQAIINAGFKPEFYLFFNSGKQGMLKTSVCWNEIVDNLTWCVSDSGKITSNFGIVELKYVPIFKNITSFIATIAEHKNCPSTGDLYVLNGDSSFGLPLTVKKNFIVNGTETSSPVYVSSVYNYNRQFKGLCGSVLVAPTLGSGAGSIIGIHIAGSSSSGNGYAEPLYRELFSDYFEVVKPVEVMALTVEPDIDPIFDLDSNLMMYGCVNPKFAQKQSGKSKIVPSLLSGEIYPVRTEVNPLMPGDKRQPPGSHPLRDGCEKHGSGDIKVFDSRLVTKVQECLSDRLQQVSRPVRAEVTPLSLQQAVCGDVNVPYFEPLNWKSSEGFPLSSHRPSAAHDKKWLFDLTETEGGYKLNSLHPLLNQQLKFRDACYEKNVKPPTIYVDCLKDARLPPKKCAQPGKTRIFSVAPVQCSIDIRMYINDFCASIKNSRITNSIAIGINPDSLEWTQLANYLFEAGSKIITLDYSNYGPCLMSQLVKASNEVIVAWHQNYASEAHAKRVAWLLDCDILNPVHLAGNVVYQTLNGISSGSPLTGECNSLPNLFYIRVVWLEIMTEHFPEWASMYYFDFHIRLVVYGDDLIMSVSDEASLLFNAITIRDALKRHGITVTSAQKDSEMTPYTSIYEATFLKRGFKEHPFRKGVWLAPIETQSIEECINWVHASDNIQEATLECCRASLDLAYGQGPKYYQDHYNNIKTYLNKTLGLSLLTKSWYIRDNEIFGDSITKSAPVELKIKLPIFYDLVNMEL